MGIEFSLDFARKLTGKKYWPIVVQYVGRHVGHAGKCQSIWTVSRIGYVASRWLRDYGLLGRDGTLRGWWRHIPSQSRLNQIFFEYNFYFFYLQIIRSCSYQFRPFNLRITQIIQKHMKNILSKFENYRVGIYGGVCVYIYIYIYIYITC